MGLDSGAKGAPSGGGVGGGGFVAGMCLMRTYLRVSLGLMFFSFVFSFQNCKHGGRVSVQPNESQDSLLSHRHVKCII